MADANTGNGEQTWTAPRPLTWQHWDGEYVAYDGVSGDTHLCDPVTAEILRQLGARAQTRSDLLQYVADRLHLEPDGDLDDYIGQCLEELSRRSLIFPVKS